MKCSRKKFKDVAYVMISWVSLNIICSINEKYNIISKKTCFKSEFFFISSRKYSHETIYGIISLYLLGTKKNQQLVTFLERIQSVALSDSYIFFSLTGLDKKDYRLFNFELGKLTTPSKKFKLSLNLFSTSFPKDKVKSN